MIIKKPSLKDKFPEILNEWAYDRNILLPEMCSPKDAAKVQWKCNICGEYWPASVGNRTHRNSACPFCSGHKVSDKNRLSIKYPDLVHDWDYNLNDKKPDEVSVCSTYKAMWKCKDCDKSYPARIYSRTQRNDGCSFCSGKRVSDKNRLSTNYPELLDTWDWNKNKNGPDKYSYGSSKKVYWKCNKCPHGYEWEAPICNRTIDGKGCKYCSNHISKPQKRIYSEILWVFEDAKLEYRIENEKSPIDIYIPSLKFGIEFDGLYYHSDSESENRDINKNSDMKLKYGIKIIRIREEGLIKIDKKDIKVPYKKDISKNVMDNIFKNIKSIFKLSPKMINRIDCYLEENKYQNSQLYKEMIH